MLKIVSPKILRVRPEFTEPVLSFQHTAFRLEVRDRYNEPSEAGTVHRFLDSGELDDSLLATWTANIGKRTEGGRRMERVQMVSEPHSAIRNRRGCSVRLWQHVGGTGAQSTFSNGADDGFLANNAIGDNRASAVDVCVRICPGTVFRDGHLRPDDHLGWLPGAFRHRAACIRPTAHRPLRLTDRLTV